MYPSLTDTTLDAIWAHARQEAPKEAVGLLQGQIAPINQLVMPFTWDTPLENESEDPANFFVLSGPMIAKILARRAKGDLLCLWHSHVDRLPNLSSEDQHVMWALKLPMLVVGLAYKVAVMYTYLQPQPTTGKHPIVEWGRWKQP